jgi:exosome complex RNA-binding protein Rrp42 (RNase PH superfamily)
MEGPLFSANDANFVLRGLLENVRVDGRSMLEYRKVCARRRLPGNRTSRARAPPRTF